MYCLSFYVLIGGVPRMGPRVPFVLFPFGYFPIKYLNSSGTRRERVLEHVQNAFFIRLLLSSTVLFAKNFPTYRQTKIRLIFGKPKTNPFVVKLLKILRMQKTILYCK